MKVLIFAIVGLLLLIGAGAIVIYKIGEAIVETQDTTCHGEYGRWGKEHEKAKEDSDGAAIK